MERRMDKNDTRKGKVPITVWILFDEKECLKAVAEHRGVSMTAVVRRLINEHLII